jgi:hypothetical protein
MTEAFLNLQNLGGLSTGSSQQTQVNSDLFSSLFSTASFSNASLSTAQRLMMVSSSMTMEGTSTTLPQDKLGSLEGLLSQLFPLGTEASSVSAPQHIIYPNDLSEFTTTYLTRLQAYLTEFEEEQTITEDQSEAIQGIHTILDDLSPDLNAPEMLNNPFMMSNMALLNKDPLLFVSKIKSDFIASVLKMGSDDNDDDDDNDSGLSDFSSLSNLPNLPQSSAHQSALFQQSLGL